MVRLTEEGIFFTKSPESLQKSFLLGSYQPKKWEKLMVFSSLQRVVSLLNAESIVVPPILATGPIDSYLPQEGTHSLSAPYYFNKIKEE